MYNDHYIHYLERNKKIVDFQLKDKIMATKNSDVLLYVEEDSPEKKIAEKDSHEETPEEGKEFVQTSERLMNGSIYVIKGVSLLTAMEALAFASATKHTKASKSSDCKSMRRWSGPQRQRFCSHRYSRSCFPSCQLTMLKLRRVFLPIAVSS